MILFNHHQHKLSLSALWEAIAWGQVVFIVWAGLVSVGTGVDIAFFDKAMHFLTYFIAAFWFTGLYKRRFLVYVVAGLILLGIGVEFLQGLTDYRTSEFMDIVANALGVFAGGFSGAHAGARVFARMDNALSKTV